MIKKRPLKKPSFIKFSLLSTIKGKLYFSVFLVVLSLVLVSGTAFYKSARMVKAGEDIYIISLKGIEVAGKVGNFYQRARGTISRAPAELDLTKMEALKEEAHQSITQALAVINEHKQKINEDGVEIVASIENILQRMNESGDKVFELAGLFAADQANEELGSTFASIEDDMEAQLMVFTSE